MDVIQPVNTGHTAVYECKFTDEPVAVHTANMA